jgi:hypothetical protein
MLSIGRLGGESKVEQVSHQLIKDRTISRRKTFKRCGRSEAFVEHQQLVQKVVLRQ